MSVIPTANIALDRLCYIYAIPIDGCDNIASRTVIRNPCSTTLTQHDYSPTATLRDALIKGTCQSDIKNARSEQALLQLSDALDNAIVNPGSNVIVYCDEDLLHAEDALRPIAGGNCDIQALATYFDAESTISLCWVACGIMDVKQKGGAVEFHPIRTDHRLALAGLDGITPKETSRYNRGISALYARIGQLYEKAASGDKYDIKLLQTMEFAIHAHRQYRKVPDCDYPPELTVSSYGSSNKVSGYGMREFPKLYATTLEDLVERSGAAASEPTNVIAETSDTSRQLPISTQRASASSVKGKENREGSPNAPLQVRPKKRSSDSDEVQKKPKRRIVQTHSEGHLETISGGRPLQQTGSARNPAVGRPKATSNALPKATTFTLPVTRPTPLFVAKRSRSQVE
ncbi:hypothetical protein CYLTODRAFT_490324 [Cylindrobasidium torrendii FP15055 ss-10]|uniref:Uncharacterized protein n=1 Tax=Cylindrobasidium torrendii FP15055 ss-10 TaxID=1314674 RepID=A0A0D7BBE2_9AGAR|nr:hypothetical protein CYLTODRAFT_490324 [Cylindrobasidium torrendii FP15055 ss-10]